MRFIGYWSGQLLVAEFTELLSCRHYYRDAEYYEPGDWVIKASGGTGAGRRSYFICPRDSGAKEGYRPFTGQAEANKFIEAMIALDPNMIDLRSLEAVCAFMEDTYAKVELIDKSDYN